MPPVTAFAWSWPIIRETNSTWHRRHLQLRARKAGAINKILLTLGRAGINVVVVNTLDTFHRGVYSPIHLMNWISLIVVISYTYWSRGSKFTRLLNDSLGSTAKICIIAMVSPTIHCLNDTLSALGNVFHAKNIKNRPQLEAPSHIETCSSYSHNQEDKLNAFVTQELTNQWHVSSMTWNPVFGHFIIYSLTIIHVISGRRISELWNCQKLTLKIPSSSLKI